jgi:membrane-bound metal-dependent hydrolase YbcI (DUF457 family)
MDPVTHTLVGVGLANAFFRKGASADRGSLPILAIASNLPDLDAVVHLTGDPAAVLMRRTFGHSLFLVPLWSLALALVLRRFWPGRGLRAIYGMTLLGACVHLLFDLINSFGVVLLWPASDWRPELAIVFIIDFALTGLLALPLLIVAARPRLRPLLPPLSRLSLACVALYLLFCGANRALAAGLLARETREPVDFSYVFPEPLGPHRWRGVLRRGDEYRLYLIHSLTGRVEPAGTIRTDGSEPRVAAARRTPFGRRLDAFFKAPVWRLARTVTATVTAYDLRFQSLVLHRAPVFQFTLALPPGPTPGPALDRPAAPSVE